MELVRARSILYKDDVKDIKDSRSEVIQFLFFFVPYVFFVFSGGCFV